MDCQRCGKSRVAGILIKGRDEVHSCSPEGIDGGNGRAPSDVGIGEDGYIEFKWCLECGQIQGEFPISVEAEQEAFGYFKEEAEDRKAQRDRWDEWQRKLHSDDEVDEDIQKLIEEQQE